jgi:hypothetical protein
MLLLRYYLYDRLFSDDNFDYNYKNTITYDYNTEFLENTLSEHG